MNDEVYLVWYKSYFYHLNKPFRVLESIYSNEEDAKERVKMFLRHHDTMDAYYEKRKVESSF